MENLFPAIVAIIAIIGGIISSARKEREKQAAKERHRAAAAARVQAAQQRMAAAAPAKPLQSAATPAQPLTVVQPQVHTHTQPDCVTHNAPGSLGVISTEGKDPCHEDQLTLERTFANEAQEEGCLSLEWTGENMVKAVVMQEVLTRPCQRRAR